MARVPARSKDLFQNEDAAADGSGYSAKDIEVLEGLEPVRRRPGMYIGGTDERALHHLFAEVLDNAMDEAVAGHATFIEVELKEDGTLAVTDNGRGIPVDPHPKFKDKSALEVVMTMLHSGGKFGGKAYETSGGLHGVGVSVVNALSEHLEVEVALNKTLYRQTYSRGHATSKLKNMGAVHNRRGTKVSFRPDPEIFGKAARFKPARLYRMARSKAYLFGGVKIRWVCAPSLITDDTPAEDTLHFPGGLKDYLAASIEGAVQVTDEPFAGKVSKAGSHGSVEWAIAWVADRDGFLNSYCNTIPTTEGGTHEAGLRTALARALKDYAERVGNKKGGQILPEDVLTSAAGLLSVFIREPEFQGQTKEKLASAEAQRLVEAAVRDHFDHWLADSPSRAGKLLDWVVERSEERLRRRREKEIGRQSATRKLRLPGKLADCSDSSAQGTEIFLVEGDSAGGLGEAGARPHDAGDPSLARQDPQRRLRRHRQARPEPGAQRSRAGPRLRRARALPRRRPALRPRHHHDRRRCRWRAHRLAPHHVLLQGAPRPHRRRPPLSRRAAALPPGAGRQDPLCPR